MNFPTDKFITFAKQYNVPNYVKTASTKDFADIDDPRTKVACYFARFAALTGDLTASAREQHKRAQILNISDDIDNLEADYAKFQQQSQVKTAAPTEKYPVRNKKEFMAAVNYLEKNAYALPLVERRELAGKLIKEAANYDIPVNEQLCKFAGQGKGNVSRLIPNLHKRADLVRISTLHNSQTREKTAQDLEVLAEIARVQPNNTTTAENLNKIAFTLQFIDSEYGLNRHYADGYIDPPDNAVFSLNEKTAEEIEKYACKIVGSEVYDIREFEQIKLADIVDTMGADFAAVMSEGLALKHEKIAEVLDVMTSLEKIVFADIVKAAGIKPKYCQQETVNLRELTQMLA